MSCSAIDGTDPRFLSAFAAANPEMGIVINGNQACAPFERDHPEGLLCGNAMQFSQLVQDAGKSIVCKNYGSATACIYGDSKTVMDTCNSVKPEMKL